MILNLGEWPRRAVLSYSGTYTTKTITVNGKSYTLYSFTGSGTLSVSGGKLKNADIWACGGGGSPALIKTARGGGGGYTAQLNGQTLPIGQYVITIGAAQAATSIARGGTALLTANGAPVLSGTSDPNRGKGRQRRRRGRGRHGRLQRSGNHDAAVRRYRQLCKPPLRGRRRRGRKEIVGQRRKRLVRLRRQGRFKRQRRRPWFRA